MISMGLRFENNTLLILDQTRLPHEEIWISCQSTDEMVGLIKRLAIRGAPLIGVGAALALADFVEKKYLAPSPNFGASSKQRSDSLNFIETVSKAANQLRAARPTAVNLMWAMDRLILKKDSRNITPEALVREAEAIFDEDVALSEGMSNRGADLIQDGDSLLTHCNTGGLATAGNGTALGAIRRAHEQGKKIHVYVDETRPLLQGARLTTWELKKLGIPHTLICDNMAGYLMSQGKVNRVFVGSDRIARNGDFANKIGTYGLAVLAHHHRVPFYVVAPVTTLDLNCTSGSEIPVEERAGAEVLGVWGTQGTPVWNPSFDVTPRGLISGIVLNDRMM